MFSVWAVSWKYRKWQFWCVCNGEPGWDQQCHPLLPTACAEPWLSSGQHWKQIKVIAFLLFSWGVVWFVFGGFFCLFLVFWFGFGFLGCCIMCSTKRGDKARGQKWKYLLQGTPDCSQAQSSALLGAERIKVCAGLMNSPIEQLLDWKLSSG